MFAACWGVGRAPAAWACLVLGIAGAASSTARAVTPPAASPRHRDDACLRSLWFADARYGWASGDRGCLLHTRDGGRTWLPQESRVGCTLSAVRFLDRQRGWAVGGWIEPDTRLSRGVVLQTSNGGASWRMVEVDVPWLRHLEVESDGTLLAAGDWSPIHWSSLFESRDQGRTWQAAPASEEVGPVRSIAIGSDRAAALDHGGVVFSRRAGMWQASLARSELTALAASASQLVAVEPDGISTARPETQLAWRQHAGWASARERPPAVPLDEPRVAAARGAVCWMAGAPAATVVRWTAEDGPSTAATGMLGTVHALHFLDEKNGWAAGSFGQVAVTTDGGRSWKPVRGRGRRAGLLVVGERAEEIPWLVVGMEAAERGVRTVVGVGEARPRAADPLRADPEVEVGEAVRELGGCESLVLGQRQEPAEMLRQWQPVAVVLAADVEEDLRGAWTEAVAAANREGGPQRLLQIAGEDRSRSTVRDSTVLPSAGDVLGHMTARASAVLDPDRSRPAREDLSLLWSAVGSGGGRIESVLPPLDPETRERALRTAAGGSVRHLALVQARARYDEFVARLGSETADTGPNAVRKRLEGLLRNIGQGERTTILRLAEEDARSRDHPERWRAVLQAAESTTPDTGYGRRAALRLRQIERSKEWRKLRRQPAAAVQPAGGERPAASASRSPFERDEPAIRPTAASEPVPHDAARRQPSEPGDLAWSQHPSWMLIEPDGDAARPNQLNRMNRWVRHPISGDWGRAIRWRRDSADDATPDADHRIAFASAPPVLDGRLDDACWNEPADGSRLRLAYDASHVYFAARLAGTPGANPGGTGRRRDGASADRPRAVLEIDIDGDLATAYRLEIDDRGWTRDSCDGFNRWQPRWYVALGADEDDGWIIEAAIDRRDLDDLPPVAGQAWRVRHRVLPPGVELPRGPAGDAAGWRLAVFE